MQTAICIISGKNELGEIHASAPPAFAAAQPPARVVKLVARNDQGHPMDAYFGFKSESEGWVALCAPDCAPEFFFLMNRHD